MEIIAAIILVLSMLVAFNIAYCKDCIVSNFIAVINTSLFSILCVLFYIFMDAVDVAFTEAAVGVGISTALLLLTVTLTRSHKVKPTAYNPLGKILLVIFLIIIGILFIYALLDAPQFMAIDNPYNNDIYWKYITESYNVYKVPNIVTMILGSYRGFDTMGETMVIFTAAIGVYALLKTNKPPR